MINSLRLIVYELKRSARIALPLNALLLSAEMLFFFALSVAGSKKLLLPGGMMYTLIPGLFYVIALTVPLKLFIKSTAGSDSLFFHSLPVYPDTPLSAMMICSLIWAMAAEILRTTTCAFSLIMTSSLIGINRQQAVILLFSVYGMSGYVMAVTRNILAVVFLQLFVSMITLIASMSRSHKKLLTVIYGTVGSTMIFFAFAYLFSETDSETSSGAAFFHYLPQIVCLLCFITLFGVVSAFIMKRRHEVS